MQKISFILLISGLLFSAGLAMAQEDAVPVLVATSAEETATEATDTTAIDEFSATLDETVEDLGVGEPNILPDSPFYFLKQWSRTIQNVFAFTPVAKAQLKEKFAGEKLLEVKKMVEQNRNQEQIENAIRNYQEEIGEMERVTERIRETAEESEQVGKFLDKFIQQQTVHQKVLQKLEEQVPSDVFEKIQEVREEHLEKFGQVMTRLENKENLQERLEQNLQEMAGSEFKEFKSLEVLKQLEEKVPEEAKEAIQGVQENLLLKLKEKLEQLPPQTQQKFQDYVEKISGEKETQLEIIDSLKEKLPLLQENLLQSRERILKQIQEKTQLREQNQTTAPAQEEVPPTQSTSPQPVPKQEQERVQACTQLWDPVCGKDGKTYSNDCFAEAAGTDVAYKGECKEQAAATTSANGKSMFQQQIQQIKELLPGTGTSE